MTEKLAQTIEFTERLVKYATPTEVMVFKQLLHTRLQVFLAFNPDSNNILQTSCELDFPPLNVNVARQQVMNLMGSFVFFFVFFHMIRYDGRFVLHMVDALKFLDSMDDAL